MKENSIDQMLENAKKNLRDIDVDYPKKMETETNGDWVLSYYKLLCARKRIKMLEIFQNYSDYVDVKEMSYEELNKIKNDQINELKKSLQKCDDNLETKLIQLNKKKRQKDEAMKENTADKADLDKIDNEIKLLSNEFATLQKESINTNTELDEWKSFSIEDVRQERLTLVSDHNIYVNFESIKYFKEIDDLRSVIDKNPQILVEFINMIKKYNSLLTQYNDMLKCPTLIYDNRLKSLCQELNKFRSIHNSSISDAYLAGDIINRYQTELLSFFKMLEVDQLKKFFALFHSKDRHKIDENFVKEYFNSEDSVNWCCFKEKNNQKKNYETSKKIKFFKNRKNKKCQKEIYDSYHALLSDVKDWYLDRFIEFGLNSPELKKQFLVCFESSDSNKYNEFFDMLKKDKDDLRETIALYKKQTNAIIKLEKGSIETIEKQFDELFNFNSTAREFLNCFYTESPDERVIVNQLASITVDNEAFTIKKGIILNSKIRSHLNAAKILENLDVLFTQNDDWVKKKFCK